MRAAAVCLLGLALALSGPSVAVAKKPTKRASACQKLSKRYADVATSRKLVAVVRGSDETGRISACVLPRGKVRTLAAWDDGLGRDWGSIVDTAGTWVLFEQGHGDQYGGVSRTLTRVEVRHNRRVTLSSYGCMLGWDLAPCPDGTNYGLVGIAPNGAGAVALSDFATGTATLQAFDSAGVFTKLADGVIEALRVTTTQINWRQRGIGHTAPLPE
ncbi:hypothetical protein BH20ACT17_BH20ACT17_02680 [soil metagenome]